MSQTNGRRRRGRGGLPLVFDLRDVTLVNQDAIKFLSSCEADSIKLENYPAYIREWIVVEFFSTEAQEPSRTRVPVSPAPVPPAF